MYLNCEVTVVHALQMGEFKFESYTVVSSSLINLPLNFGNPQLISGLEKLVTFGLKPLEEPRRNKIRR